MLVLVFVLRAPLRFDKTGPQTILLGNFQTRINEEIRKSSVVMVVAYITSVIWHGNLFVPSNTRKEEVVLMFP